LWRFLPVFTLVKLDTDIHLQRECRRSIRAYPSGQGIRRNCNVHRKSWEEYSISFRVGSSCLYSSPLDLSTETREQLKPAVTTGDPGRPELLGVLDLSKKPGPENL